MDLRRYRLASYFNGYQQRLCGQQDSAAVFCEWPRVDTVVDEQINLTRLVVGATNHFATNSFEAARQAALKKATDTVLSHPTHVARLLLGRWLSRSCSKSPPRRDPD